MGKFNLKKTALLCMMAVMVFAMTACGKNSTASGKEEDGKLKVVTTIFPYYDFFNDLYIIYRSIYIKKIKIV